MESKITRLKVITFVLASEDMAKQYTVRYNSNEEEQNLEISLHYRPAERIDINELTGKRFFIQVNSNEPTLILKRNAPLGGGLVRETEPVVTKPSKDPIEAIYQFSVPFEMLVPNDNILILYEADISTDEDETTAEIGLELGSLECFKEVESDVTTVRLERPGNKATTDQSLWGAIKSRWAVINKNTLRFNEYRDFIDAIIFSGDASKDNIRTANGESFVNTKSTSNLKRSRIRSPFIKSDEYNLIKFATEFYMLAKFGMDTKQLTNYLPNGKLPYYELIVENIKKDANIEQIVGRHSSNPQRLKGLDYITYERIYNPIMIELIWSYWMEQGMLVQTLNVINLRFQNIKGRGYADPLQRFDADSLRPLSHILWGFIQDEQHRLSIQRRLYEYDHEYGLTLVGKAVPRIAPVDTRVPFLEAFHSLLNQCTVFFHESDDTTRIADAFPILNSLKEVHLLLAEGNHNAYGNLTWTARHEMMIQQYILSRPEMREFLGGRIMVPYPETWMDRVDAMRNIQGWGAAGIVHYYELAVHGEMILLSIRYGNWSDVTLDRNNAANWAQEFRNSIQRYIHAYRAVTGVDLSAITAEQIQNNGTFALQPAYLIQQRMLQERVRQRRA